MALVQVQASGGEGVQPGVSAAAAQTSGTMPRWQVVAASFAAIGVAWLVSITINAAFKPTALVIPAGIGLFAMLYAVNGGANGPLSALNIMGLRTPQSAILSAVIFNALIIIALIPLALKGVKYRPMSAASLLRRNLFIYGFGGLVAPFVGIKIIDVIIHAVGLA